MSLVEIEQTVRELSDSDQKRLIALLVAERTKRSGDSLQQKAARLEDEGSWISWESVKADLDIGEDELKKD